METNGNGTGKRTQGNFTDLEDVIEKVHEIAGNTDLVKNHGWTKEDLAVLERAAAHLEWLSEFLENRKLYHKKQNAKKNLAVKALQKLLSADELRAIDAEADRLIGNVRNPNEIDDETE